MHFVNAPADSRPQTLPDRESIWQVSIRDCRTCVGLYIKIAEDRCIMLHIDAKSRSAMRRNERPPWNRIVTPFEGAKIHHWFMTRFATLERMAGWRPSGHEPVVMCCPMFDNEDGALLAGRYVTDAINEWLERTVRREP